MVLRLCKYQRPRPPDYSCYQEESSRVRAVLQAERDEAVTRSKKLARQCDKLTVQLTDARAQVRDLNAQLADAAEYKVRGSDSQLRHYEADAQQVAGPVVRQAHRTADRRACAGRRRRQL